MKKMAVGIITFFLLVSRIHAIEKVNGSDNCVSLNEYGIAHGVMAWLTEESSETFSWENMGANIIQMYLRFNGIRALSSVKWEPLPVEVQDFEAMAEKLFSALYQKK